MSKNEKNAKLIRENKAEAQNQLNIEKEKISISLEEVQKILAEHQDQISKNASDAKVHTKQEISGLQTMLTERLQTELEKLQTFVRVETSNVNKNNDDIYLKYDGKLKKIKDVCAQYFSKYEKHLINHQTIVKDLQSQQEQWVEMLIKPQQLNQARLFTIETRIQENEQNKMQEVDFMKETIKKLIYAIEQQQVSAVKKPPAENNYVSQEPTISKSLPGLSSKIKSRQRNRDRNYSQRGSTGGFFQESAPAFETQADTGMQAQQSQPLIHSQPSSSEVLFLKRLLYLKASIDNESTLNAFSVPFEQEKLRDMASPEQLMMDTTKVGSQKTSIDYASG